MAEFLAEGHFARHIRKMRAVFKARHDLLLEMGQRQLAGLLELQPDDTGLRVLGLLPVGTSDRVAAQAAEAHGVEVSPLSQFYYDGQGRPGLVLGFGSTDEAGIRAGLGRLRQALVASRSAMSD